MSVAKFECLNCSSSVKKYNSAAKYCSNICQMEFQRKQTIQRWLDEEIDGSGKAAWRLLPVLRNYLLEKANHSCTECFWNEVNPVTLMVPLQIDHIDGDCTNNRFENLRVLCPNCHSLTPNYGALNKGMGSKERMTTNKVGRSKHGSVT